MNKKPDCSMSQTTGKCNIQHTACMNVCCSWSLTSCEQDIEGAREMIKLHSDTATTAACTNKLYVRMHTCMDVHARDCTQCSYFWLHNNIPVTGGVCRVRSSCQLTACSACEQHYSDLQCTSHAEYVITCKGLSYIKHDGLHTVLPIIWRFSSLLPQWILPCLCIFPPLQASQELILKKKGNNS